MKKTLAALATAALVLSPVSASAAVRKPAPRPAPAVQILSATERCYSTGYTEVEATIKATVVTTVDVWLRMDSDNPFGTYVAATVALPVGTTVLDFPISWPQQADVVLTKPGASVDSPITEKTAPAASFCG